MEQEFEYDFYLKSFRIRGVFTQRTSRKECSWSSPGLESGMGGGKNRRDG